jgi:hypothetical protein
VKKVLAGALVMTGVKVRPVRRLKSVPSKMRNSRAAELVSD